MNNLKAKTGLDGHINKSVKVYDVEKKKLILEFDSTCSAAKALGVKNVNSYIKSKSKCYKNNLGITICFR
jgi:hypothetical protein